MFFWLFFLLGLVFAQDDFDTADVEVDDEVIPEVEKIEIPAEEAVNLEDMPIQTPEQYRAKPMNLTKIPDTREIATDKMFPIHIIFTNTADQEITNVIIYDTVPEFLKVLDGQNSSMVVDVIQPGESVNFTYEVVPILSGVHIFEGCSVNFTYNGQRQQQETQPLGQVYVVQSKGLVLVAVEWAVCIILFLVCYLIYVIHRTRVQKKNEMKLRAKGITVKQPKDAKEKKERKDEKPKSE